MLNAKIQNLGQKYNFYINVKIYTYFIACFPYIVMLCIELEFWLLAYGQHCI